MSKITKNLFVVVPLGDKGKYRIKSYEGDKTHVIAENETWWKKLFVENQFRVKSFSYKIEGIKDKWYNQLYRVGIVEQGTGIRRLHFSTKALWHQGSQRTKGETGCFKLFA